MAGSGTGDVFDVRRIRRLIQLMQEHGLVEVDLSQGDQRIKLKGATETVVQTVAAAAAPVAAAPAAPAAAAPAAEDDGKMAYITSEMVGTFYSSSNPESPAYIKIGDHVDPEMTVCIVEAMKVFNEIPAGIGGKVVAVLAEDGAPVEHGQKLFKVDTGG